MIEQLHNEWHSVAVQTAWKLEPVLCYNDIPQSQSVEEATLSPAPLTSAAYLEAEMSQCL